MGKASRRRRENRSRGRTYYRVLANVQALQTLTVERCQDPSHGTTAVVAIGKVALTMKLPTGVEAGAVELGICREHAPRYRDVAGAVQAELDAVGATLKPLDVALVLVREMEPGAVARHLRLGACLLFARNPSMGAMAMLDLIAGSGRGDLLEREAS